MLIVHSIAAGPYKSCLQWVDIPTDFFLVDFCYFSSRSWLDIQCYYFELYCKHVYLRKNLQNTGFNFFHCTSEPRESYTLCRIEALNAYRPSCFSMLAVWVNHNMVWHILLIVKCHIWFHNCDLIMGAKASQITSLTIVHSTVHSSADRRKHRSSASPAFVRGIHRWPMNSTHKWPVTRKMFPFDDVIMVNLFLIYISVKKTWLLCRFEFYSYNCFWNSGFLSWFIFNPILKGEHPILSMSLWQRHIFHTYVDQFSLQWGHNERHGVSNVCSAVCSGKENINFTDLFEEFTGDRWISFTKCQ